MSRSATSAPRPSFPGSFMPPYPTRLVGRRDADEIAARAPVAASNRIRRSQPSVATSTFPLQSRRAVQVSFRDARPTSLCRDRTHQVDAELAGVAPTRGAPMAPDDRSGIGPPPMTSCAFPFEPGGRVSIGFGQATSAALGRQLAHPIDTKALRFVLALETPRSTKSPGSQHVPLVTCLAPKSILSLAAFVDLGKADATMAFGAAT